jgi:beta-mannosidase
MCIYGVYITPLFEILRELTILVDVWHGPMHPYQSYLPLMGRFVSEFGFESPPSMRTITSMLPNPSTRQSQSLEFLAHDKGPGAERRATMYMGENFRFRMDPLEDYVYCAQLLQAEAVSFAVRSWRRNFKGPGEELCSGALVWQLNDK